MRCGPSARRSSPIDLELVHDGAVGKPDDLAPVLERLANLLVLGTAGRPRVLLVDDLDRLDDPTLNPLWDQLADHDDFRMIATIENRSMTGYTASGMLNLARRSRRVLVLRPDDAGDFLQMTGIKPPIRPGLAMPPGSSGAGRRPGADRHAGRAAGQSAEIGRRHHPGVEGVLDEAYPAVACQQVARSA